MHKCRALGKDLISATKILKMCITFNGIQFILNNHTKSTVNSTKIHLSPCYVLQEYLNTSACTE